MNREGTQRTAPTPSPVPAARGQRISRGRGTGIETELLPGWFCIPCHTHPGGGHLGTCLQPPQLLQSMLDMGPHWSKLAVGAGITISSWQCLGNVRIDTHRAGQGARSKGHFVVRGWGPNRTRAAKGTGTVTAREGTPRCHQPFLQGTDLPRSTARHGALPTALPETGNPTGSPAPPKRLLRNSAHSSAPGRDREQQSSWGAASQDQENLLSVPSAAGCGALPSSSSSTLKLKPPTIQHSVPRPQQWPHSHRDRCLLREGLSPP